MQMYVNFYHQERAPADDNPPIGLILCADKNEAVVRYTLGAPQSRILASRYQLYLPSEEELAAEVRREQERFRRKKLMDIAPTE